MADTVQITMPQMGESVSEGTVLTWHKQEGDWVDKDETIVEISTDKVDAEVPAPSSGKLVKILAQEDETVEVGQALAEIEPGEAPASDGASPKKEPTTVAASQDNGGEPAASSTAAGTTTATPPAPSDTPSTPVARRVAAAHGIDLEQVSGSGAGGKVVKDDVLTHIEQNGGDGAGAAAPARAKPPDQVVTTQPLRGGDAALARYMSDSLSIPTATSFRTPRGGHARPAPAPAERGAEGGAARHEGLVHAPDRIRDRGRRARPPRDDPHVRRARRQAATHRARAREPGAGGGRAAQGRLAHVDRAGDQGRGRDGLRRLPRGVRGDDPQDPRRVAVARRHAGRHDDPHEPGRDRHRRIRAAPDAGAGLHHRHRRDRPSAGPARDGEVAARGAGRVEGHDHDLDLRPPGDPGRRVRCVPGPDRGAAAGWRRLLRAGLPELRAGDAGSAGSRARGGATERSAVGGDARRTSRRRPRW